MIVWGVGFEEWDLRFGKWRCGGFKSIPPVPNRKIIQTSIRVSWAVIFRKAEIRRASQLGWPIPPAPAMHICKIGIQFKMLWHTSSISVLMLCRLCQTFLIFGEYSLILERFPPFISDYNSSITLNATDSIAPKHFLSLRFCSHLYLGRHMRHSHTHFC